MSLASCCGRALLTTFLFSYRTANLLLAGIMPGPKEADVEQVQNYLCILVNELERLWANGVIIKTAKYPNGRLVRVALVAVVCDKPAAHKLGGFGSHSHRLFCTKCWVSQDKKATQESFACDGMFYVVLSLLTSPANRFPSTH